MINKLAKIIAILILFVSLLMVGLWFSRDPLLQLMGNLWATPITQFLVRLDEVDTIPEAGLTAYRFKVSGTVEKAPFTLEGKVDLFPLRVKEHTLRVDDFPLPKANRKIGPKTGMIFESGTADIVSTGTASMTELDFRANLNLRHFQVRQARRSLIPVKTGLANLMGQQGGGFKMTVYVRGNPLNPQIILPEDVTQALKPVTKPIRQVPRAFKKAGEGLKGLFR